MSDFELDIWHSGMTIGMAIGVILALCGKEVVRGAREWWRHMHTDRQFALLRPRCDRHDECVAGRGHAGPCDVEPYE